jgi:hypothetical protein
LQHFGLSSGKRCHSLAKASSYLDFLIVQGYSASFILFALSVFAKGFIKATALGGHEHDFGSRRTNEDKSLIPKA